MKFSKFFVFIFYFKEEIHFCQNVLELKVFRKTANFDEGFLYKNLLKSKRSLPLKCQKFHYDTIKFFCSQINYVGFHGLSYPKQLPLNTSYIISSCTKFKCNL